MVAHRRKGPGLKNVTKIFNMVFIVNFEVLTEVFIRELSPGL
jgi:hypothetical protein